MSLYEKLIKALPELTEEDFNSVTGSIILWNDSDGEGDYIAAWNYSQPLPKGFKVGK